MSFALKNPLNGDRCFGRSAPKGRSGRRRGGPPPGGPRLRRAAAPHNTTNSPSKTLCIEPIPLRSTKPFSINDSCSGLSAAAAPPAANRDSSLREVLEPLQRRVDGPLSASKGDSHHLLLDRIGQRYQTIEDPVGVVYFSVRRHNRPWAGGACSEGVIAKSTQQHKGAKPSKDRQRCI
jgi:hypothetical protein